MSELYERIGAKKKLKMNDELKNANNMWRHKMVDESK